MSSSPALEEELRRTENGNVIVVDLRELDFVDSTGLGVLVKTHQHLAENGGRLALIQGEGQVKRLLELTGLIEQLQTYPDPDAAFEG